ncbi:OmpA family protein [Fulvivirgaceae bacterium BMA12]|uniref:OmpA family protein n=1 Tax=Agaribacillus aureus TaxID=3051825 RepID=A0ABT8L7H1_9BACT|nr:OmpA family protein [Fulvivirgaceae bacterium BMA12]
MMRYLALKILILMSGHLSLEAQRLEFGKAVMLDSMVNTEAEEINPRITGDGERLYFTRAFYKKNIGGQYAGQDIWYSEQSGQQWTRAKNLKALNDRDNNAVLGLNKAADKLYLINNYTSPARRELGLVVVNKGEGRKQWREKKELPVRVQVPNDHYGFYLTPDEQVLIISMMGEESLGEEDLYVTINEGGEWSKPKHLGRTINSTGYEISPFLSSDKQTLYFSSTGFEGAGNADIFSAKRLDDSWTNRSSPKNLGGQINSEFFDAYFIIGDDGTAYFSSNRGGGMCDIYLSKVSIIEEQLEEPKKEEIITDQVVESNGQESVTKGITVPVAKPLPAQQIVYFDFDSDVLTTKSKNTLAEVLKIISGRSDLLIELHGHTDERGNENYNDDLSRRRSEAVKKYLSKNQLDISKLKIFYHGETKPAASGSEAGDHHQLNRRVAIVYKQLH